MCTGVSNCERVQTSAYAMVAGVPVALIGLLGYLAILVALRLPGEPARLAVALLAFSGFGYSAYLTGLELFDIQAVCQWCIASAAIMTALAASSVVLVLREAAAGGAAAPA